MNFVDASVGVETLQATLGEGVNPAPTGFGTHGHYNIEIVFYFLSFDFSCLELN